VEWNGSRENNLLPWGNAWMRRPNVIKDKHDPNPGRCYKMTYADFMDIDWDGKRKKVIAKAYSHDGIHWQKPNL
jgi:hypothetical protein